MCPLVVHVLQFVSVCVRWFGNMTRLVCTWFGSRYPRVQDMSRAHAAQRVRGMSTATPEFVTVGRRLRSCRSHESACSSPRAKLTRQDFLCEDAPESHVHSWPRLLSAYFSTPSKLKDELTWPRVVMWPRLAICGALLESETNSRVWRRLLALDLHGALIESHLWSVWLCVCVSWCFVFERCITF